MTTDQTGARWRKSSRSGSGNNCVEVATNLVPSSGQVLIRDSKNPTGDVLSVNLEGWKTFVAGVHGGQFRA